MATSDIQKMFNIARDSCLTQVDLCNGRNCLFVCLHTVWWRVVTK